MSERAEDEVNQTIALGEHGEWLGDVERLFLGRLPAERSAAVYAHVKACGTCERAWSRLAEAEGALFGRGEARGFSPLAAERVKDRLFAGTAAREVVRPAKVLAKWLPMASLLGAAAALALLAIALRGPGTATLPGGTGQGGTGRSEEYGVRSGAAVKLSGALGVRALAVRERDAGSFDVEDLASAGALVRGDHVKLLGTSLDGDRWVTAAVYDGTGREVARLEPQHLGAGAADASLGRAMAVTADWPVGQVKIVAVFGAERPGAAEDLGALEASDTPGRAVRVLVARVAEKGDAPEDGARERERPQAGGASQDRGGLR